MVSVLMQHIWLMHADKPDFMLQYNLQGCRRSFQKFTTYRNHIYTFHGSRIISEFDRGSSINENEPEGHSSSDEMEITLTYNRSVMVDNLIVIV